MATPSITRNALRAVPQAQITRLHLLLLGSLSLAAVAWGWFLISGEAIGASAEYLLLLGLYSVASAAFIFSRVRDEHLRFFDIPVFLTILVFVEFGLAPIECFVDPSQPNAYFAGDHSFLVTAFLYVVAGMGAFWVGSILFMGRRCRKEAVGFGADDSKGQPKQSLVLAATVGTYTVALAVRIYLFTHHLYSYLASNTLYLQHLALMQVLMVVSGFGTYALVIACIEKYLRPADQMWRLIFWGIFASECVWGLVSGMKGALLENLIIVALVSSLIQRKFRKEWVIAALAGVIVLYPLLNAYRSEVAVPQQQVTSLESLERAGRDALRKTRETEPGAIAESRSGLQDTVSRLDLLQDVGAIIGMGPEAGQLLGRERWWMIPFYPFVPRFIWHSKPVLIEGGRFSVALGFGEPGSTAWTVGTSTAVTYFGDLYARGGLSAIVAAMFILGIVAQWLTNSIFAPLDRRHLFIYASIFLAITNLEVDYFSFWTGLIKRFVILSIIAWVVYHPRLRKGRPSVAARNVFACP